jgi:hypothetical protein
MNIAALGRGLRTDLVLHSALAPDTLANALRRVIDEEHKTIFSLSGYKGDRPVLGEVSENTFRLQRRRYWRNDFAPHFYGRFRPEPGGTRIEGYFDASSWVKTFMRLWLGGVVLIGGPIFVLTILDLTTGTHLVSGDRWVGVAVFPAMLLFGILLPKLGRLLGKADERFISEHIQRTLAARIEERGLIRA